MNLQVPKAIFILQISLGGLVQHPLLLLHSLQSLNMYKTGQSAATG
jgi:hypothetical protein